MQGNSAWHVNRAVSLVLLFLLSFVLIPLSPAQADPINHTLDTNFFGMHSITTTPKNLPGVTAVRLWDTDTTWRVVNPTQGVWNWTTLDNRVRQANGSEILLVLGTTPEWAATSISSKDAIWLGSGSASPPKNLADWETYVTNTVTRYKGRIHAYQIWNEPFLTDFWRGNFSQLADLTKSAYTIIKRIDPDAVVLTAPFLPRKKNWEKEAGEYLNELAKRDWPIDVFSFHGYAEDGGTPTDHADEVQAVRSFINVNHVPSKLQIWETEVNYLQDPDKPVHLTPTTEAAWLARTYLDSSRYGVNRVYWYAYADPNPVLQVNVTRPEVLQAYRTLAIWLTGASLVYCEDNYHGYTGLTSCLYARSNGENTQTLWSDTNTEISYSFAGEGTVQTLMGTQRHVEKNEAMTIGVSPVAYNPSIDNLNPLLPHPDDTND